MLLKWHTKYDIKFGKLSSDIGLDKSVFFSILKKGHTKECSNYHTNALISHTSNVILEILQARIQQYVNQELSNVQTGFQKGRGTRDQITDICLIIEKAR